MLWRTQNLAQVAIVTWVATQGTIQLERESLIYFHNPRPPVPCALLVVLCWLRRSCAGAAHCSAAAVKRENKQKKKKQKKKKKKKKTKKNNAMMMAVMLMIRQWPRCPKSLGTKGVHHYVYDDDV